MTELEAVQQELADLRKHAREHAHHADVAFAQVAALRAALEIAEEGLSLHRIEDYAQEARDALEKTDAGRTVLATLHGQAQEIAMLRNALDETAVWLDAQGQPQAAAAVRQRKVGGA